MGAAMLAVLMVGCGGGQERPGKPDPMADLQWYLKSSTDDGMFTGINLPADNPYRGAGVLVAIVDNGVDLAHEDLKANIAPGNHSYLPPEYGFSNADHGTAVAGIIAGVEGNGVGGRGVAPQARIVAFNALRTPATANIADALRRDLDRVDISNNSWGDFNAWGEPLRLKPEIEQALDEGTRKGRSGKGVVYVFSAGNGAAVDANGIPSDNVNYSGLVNNQYTLPICAVDHQGRKTPYSESGASLLVCAPSRSLDPAYGIFTTDVSGERGYNSSRTPGDLDDKAYTRAFGGTSAAAPMVSGVVALMLQANPDLGWRDVRAILARTARRNDAASPGWSTNAAGLHVHHDYGFGLVDAGAALVQAQAWSPLGPQVDVAYSQAVNRSIPDDDPTGIDSEILVPDALRAEFVDVYFHVPDHARVGDLAVTLVSPSGTRSVLAERHHQVFEVFRYDHWRFGSLRHLGEPAQGRWRLQVQDLRTGAVGTWLDWSLVIHGYR